MPGLMIAAVFCGAAYINWLGRLRRPPQRKTRGG